MLIPDERIWEIDEHLPKLHKRKTCPVFDSLSTFDRLRILVLVAQFLWQRRYAFPRFVVCP